MGLSQTLGSFTLSSVEKLAGLGRSTAFSRRTAELRDDQKQRWQEHQRDAPSTVLVVGWKPEMHFMIAGLDIFVKKVALTPHALQAAPPEPSLQAFYC